MALAIFWRRTVFPVLGGATIRGFLFAMLIGVIIGTYSSIFIATSLVYDTSRKQGLKY